MKPSLFVLAITLSGSIVTSAVFFVAVGVVLAIGVAAANADDDDDDDDEDGCCV